MGVAAVCVARVRRVTRPTQRDVSLQTAPPLFCVFGVYRRGGGRGGLLRGLCSGGPRLLWTLCTPRPTNHITFRLCARRQRTRATDSRRWGVQTAAPPTRAEKIAKEGHRLGDSLSPIPSVTGSLGRGSIRAQSHPTDLTRTSEPTRGGHGGYARRSSKRTASAHVGGQRRSHVGGRRRPPPADGRSVPTSRGGDDSAGSIVALQRKLLVRTRCRRAPRRC